MKKLRFIILLSGLLACKLLSAQNAQIVLDYIETYRDIAIEEELRTGVPASITLAQGIHESAAGTSRLVKMSNNHFGIKCKSEWKGESVSHDDDAKGECFRKYDSALDSYRDHSDFLKTRSHYAFLFRLEPTDYIGWAQGLKKAGYATNPKYPQILIKLIRDYNLQEYTLMAQAFLKENGSEARWTSTTVVSESAMNAKAEHAVERSSDYPAGVFRINGLKAIYITAGTSYLKVAQEHDIPLKKLFEINEMEEGDIAGKDRLVFLQRKKNSAENEFHIVAAGETLYSIAQMSGMRLEALREKNLLEPGMEPLPGEKLYLQSRAPVKPLTTGTEVNARPGNSDGVMHTVESGETLYSISRKYTVTVEELMEWNSLKNHDLKAGQKLRIKK